MKSGSRVEIWDRECPHKWPQYCRGLLTPSSLMSLPAAALSTWLSSEKRWYKTAPNLFLTLQPESYHSFFCCGCLLLLLLLCHPQKFTRVETHLFCCSATPRDNFFFLSPAAAPHRPTTQEEEQELALHFSAVAKDMTWYLLSYFFCRLFFTV